MVMALVFFDFDGTLTRFDTFIPYCLIALLHRPWRIFCIKPIVKGLFAAFEEGVEREELKEAFVGAFLGGAERRDIHQWNKIFFRFVLPHTLRERIFNKLRQHQDRGDRVYIVSASPDIYLQPLAKLWRLDGVICTKLEWGRCCLTGRILGRNCRGEEKAKLIRILFNKTELVGSFAYGNSEGDRQMLELVSFGFRI